MKYLYKLFILAFFLLSLSSLMAQASVTKIGIKTIGFRTEKKIVLRWVLDDAKQWRYALKKGFDVERAEGNSNKFIKLNKSVILPISAEQLFKYDTNSLVIQAMGYLLTEPKSEDDSGVQDDKLYNVYFLNASYETEAAVQTASGFIDTTIEKGKSYTYRVRVANTTITQTIGKTIVTADIPLMPKSPKLNAVFGDGTVAFNWNIKDVDDYYFATLLERSTDSINFKRIGQPYIKYPNEGDSPIDSVTLSATDSIPNNIKFYYRIKCVNLFGLTSKPNNVVTGMGMPKLEVVPQIKSVDPTNKN
ncbi:hypothetical protein ACFOW1_15205 [Parasediminibacterium paludis]|uniref:Fibronectin type-III domain-containing protein n=1 Tax=Parasediminibacterium paludis TaxID=908966 RepID=A0ABV8PYR2_9BACT